MSVSFAVFAQANKIVEMHCFTEEVFVYQALQGIERHYVHPLQHMRHHHPAIAKAIEKMNSEKPEMEIIKDIADKFGRSFCLAAKGQKFKAADLKTIGSFQMKEDDAIKEKKRKIAQSIKDPWGGGALELNNQPRIVKSCRKPQAYSDQLECDDLIITARSGEDNVTEYRFWLGFQSGEGLTVYKSPGDFVELSKVMAQLKKDKKEFKYSFVPKDMGHQSLVENAKIGGD